MRTTFGVRSFCAHQASGSTFGYTEQSLSTSEFDDGGDVTSGLVVTAITPSTTASLALQIVLTGPIAAMTNGAVGYSTTLSRSEI